MRARSIPWIVIAMVVVVAACTVAPAASPPASASPTPNPVALVSPSPRPTSRPTPRPTPTPSPTPTATPSPSPSSGLPTPLADFYGTPHADPDLESYLPTLMSGTPLARLSTEGSVFTGGSDMCILLCGDEPTKYAKELGIPVDHVTVAFAVSDSLALGMIGYRARGAKPDRLIPARIAIGGQTGNPGPSWKVTVAGRPVTFLFSRYVSGEYLYARDELLFIVFGQPPDKAGKVPSYITEAIGSIP
jgi:hypothetical protein